MTALRAHWPEALLLAGVLAVLTVASAATGVHPVQLLGAGALAIGLALGVIP